MKVALFVFLVASITNAQLTVPEVIEASRSTMPEFSMDESIKSFKDIATMEESIKEKMLDADQTMDMLYNMTSSLTLDPLSQYGAQAATFFSEMALPYGLAILIVLGLFYTITSLVGLVLNTKMTFLGLLSDFLSSNMDVFSKENMEAANEAANRMLTDAVYTAIDRMGSVYGN